MHYSAFYFLSVSDDTLSRGEGKWRETTAAQSRPGVAAAVTLAAATT
jgi:hypothetical protein